MTLARNLTAEARDMPALTSSADLFSAARNADVDRFETDRLTALALASLSPIFRGARIAALDSGSYGVAYRLPVPVSLTVTLADGTPADIPAGFYVLSIRNSDNHPEAHRFDRALDMDRYHLELIGD